jgi:hypothetical protein
VIRVFPPSFRASTDRILCCLATQELLSRRHLREALGLWQGPALAEFDRTAE